MNEKSDCDSGMAVPGPSSANKSFDIENDSNNGSSMLSPSPPKKITKRQKFRDAWLQDPNFTSWLQKCENPFRAKCTVCNSIFTAGKSDLLKHMKTVIHRINIQNRIVDEKFRKQYEER
ncbi:PREDICTED: uncharacterized protein LOC107190385 [Dufourea novaeangliae]|uniref:Uncharacterized protein n=1 Tax=Dufourea novaeangliae TaxID=178035 RepID=A0A154PK71_DUFNO|nr:PREDICTED: uncharacterized protein LOC107190385 [Dufourea novaeangliae]KZC12223.1 hypothetical protein WN55_03737 [Dufourea novaeangliae]